MFSLTLHSMVCTLSRLVRINRPASVRLVFLTCLIHSSQECLGFHGGKPFTANLGDGNGWKEVLVELRQDYNNDLLGSCLETFIGGNHFR